MIYWELFLSFLQVGLFSFGGGYAAMPLIRGQVVTVHHWLSMSEFTDLITISQMTPGPIAVNSATFVGTKIAGTLGALVATFGCILPSCIIVTVPDDVSEIEVAEILKKAHEDKDVYKDGYCPYTLLNYICEKQGWLFSEFPFDVELDFK